MNDEQRNSCRYIITVVEAFDRIANKNELYKPMNDRIVLVLRIGIYPRMRCGCAQFTLIRLNRQR